MTDLVQGREGTAPQQDESSLVIKADQIDSLRAELNVIFLDIRKHSEIEELGTLPGYTHIPLGELKSRMNELPKDRKILTA